jgi:hypothetical protein
MSSDNFLKEQSELNQTNYNNIIKKIHNYDKNVFIDTDLIKNELKLYKLEECKYFKVIDLECELYKSNYEFKLPTISPDTIYMNNKYSLNRIIILLENNAKNSIFYFNFKNSSIKTLMKNTIYITNPIEFYKNITGHPYFSNKTSTNTNNLSLIKFKYAPLKMLVFYSFKEKIDINNHLIYNTVDENQSNFYYINLHKDIERRQNIETAYSLLNPIRVKAIKNTIGYVGLLYTNYYLLISLCNKNMLKSCPVILEDDFYLLDTDILFLERWNKYKNYLINNWGKWNYFSGGCIYIEPLKIINKDPCIVECKYGLCTQFIVHSDKSAKKVINYVNKNNINTGIDRLLSDRTDTFWVPYPFFCIQKSKETNICTRMESCKYLNIIQQEFNKSQVILKNFVNKKYTTVKNSDKININTAGVNKKYSFNMINKIY